MIERLAHDLRTAFPDMKGFPRANLMYMRAFAEAWPDAEIIQQAVGQLPWGHNLVLLTKLKDPAMRLTYAQRAIQHGWSRNVLNIHIETRLLEREGQAVTNFAAQLPAPHINDIARERRAISADTALRLARYFGTSAEFWLGLQSDYDMKIALAEHGARINQDMAPMEQAA